MFGKHQAAGQYHHEAPIMVAGSVGNDAPLSRVKFGFDFRCYRQVSKLSSTNRIGQRRSNPYKSRFESDREFQFVATQFGGATISPEHSIVESKMKVCPKCGNDGDFYKRTNGKDCSICKLCQNECCRNHYEANKEQYLSRNIRYRRKLQDTINDYLRKHPCVDCGEAELSVLDFDHVRGDKKDNVSSMVAARYSWLTIRKEIMKCDVRCANCHRAKTNGHQKKYQRTCSLMDKALVYETSDDGSSPS